MDKSETRFIQKFKYKTMIKNLILPALLLSITLGNAQGKKAKSYELTSPGGQNKIKFELVDSAPKYAVSHGKTEVISPSEMGFLFKNNDDFSKNFEIIKVEKSTFDETWEQVWGEKKKKSETTTINWS